MTIVERAIGLSTFKANRKSRAKLIVPLIAGAVLACGSPASAGTPLFNVANLVTDDQSVNGAVITDPNLKNAWGLASSGSSPFWVGDNAAGVSTLYAVNPTTNVVTRNTTTIVKIPGDGTVTGVAFNSATAAGAFNADTFLFVNEDGTISGWRGALGAMGTAEVLQSGSVSNVYKGAAFGTVSPGNSYLYAANFRAGTIDVLKGTAAAANLTGNFTDPTLPAGYAPFDIKLIGGNLFVTYALQDALKHDDDPGAGHGFVDEFDLQGNLVGPGRIASMGHLNSPWGLALAPSSWGSLAGDLLVGNFGDGTIDAFDLATDAFVGELTDVNGDPLVIDGLWALSVGGGAGSGGNSNNVYFTAGPNGETDGLFGVIYVPEPASLAMFAAGLIGIGAMRRRSKTATAR
jgi:uncharacterized protein (TIGR03118 family)